jgi:hypothetical protein
MEAVRTSETSVCSETTQLYIPEGSNIRTCCCENLKTQEGILFSCHLSSYVKSSFKFLFNILLFLGAYFSSL